MPVDPRAYLQPLRNSTCFRIKISKKFGVFFGGGGYHPPHSPAPPGDLRPQWPLRGPSKACHGMRGMPWRSHCGRRLPGGAGGGGVGGISPPKIPPKKFSSQKLPEGATAATGRQKVLEGVWREMGFPPPQIFPQFFLPKFFSWRSHCGRRPPGGAREGGGGTKGGFPFPKCLFPQQFFPEGETGRMPPEGARGGGPPSA